MPKAILIILGNLIPLIGVIYWGWDLANVILLYWTENLVLGFWTIGKILTAQGKSHGKSQGRGSLGSLFLCCFFSVHYGLFCFGHLTFILSILKVNSSEGLITKGVLTGTAVMVITHGIDFFQNYLHSAQRKQDPSAIMFSPYGHIFIIHIAIIFSAALIMFTGEALGLLILIILGKIALEFVTQKRNKQKEFKAAGATDQDHA